jgi:hypothetical protein
MSGDYGTSVVGILETSIPGSGGMGTGSAESASTSMKIACAPQPRSELAQPTQPSLTRSASIGTLQSTCHGPPLPIQFGRPALKQCAGQTQSVGSGNSLVAGWGDAPGTDDDTDPGSDGGICLGRCGTSSGAPTATVGDSVLGARNPCSGAVLSTCDAHNIGQLGADGGVWDTGGDTLAWVDGADDLDTGEGVGSSAGGLNAISQLHHGPSPSRGGARHAWHQQRWP